MVMYRVDMLDLSEMPEGVERWKPDSYWDEKDEALEFLGLVEDQPFKLWRVVEVVGEVIF